MMATCAQGLTLGRRRGRDIPHAPPTHCVQHTSAYVEEILHTLLRRTVSSIRQHTSKRYSTRSSDALCQPLSIRQHTSRGRDTPHAPPTHCVQHTSAYVSIRRRDTPHAPPTHCAQRPAPQHTSAYVSIPDTVSSAQTLRRLSHINRRRQYVTCGRVSDWVARGGHALGIRSLVQVCLRAAALVSVFVLFLY
jgi:hypothetical protein